MLTLRTALIAVGLTTAAVTAATAAEPTRRWRPATTITHPVAPPNETAATPPPTTDMATWALRAYIDPRTNEAVSAPVTTPQPETLGVQRPEPKFTLQRSAEGFLFVDTTGYEYVQHATLDTDGIPHVNCDDSLHLHASAPAAAATSPSTPTVEPQP